MTTRSISPRRLWPNSLFGQLTLILVVGALSIQLLFSSIWYDVRYSQVLEIPARLVVFRTVEVMRHLASGEGFGSLETETFHIELLDAPLSRTAQPNDSQRSVERLLRRSLSHELGQVTDVSLLSLEILDEHGRPRTWASLFGLAQVFGHFDFQVRQPDGRWLHIVAVQEQGWNDQPAWLIVGDYILRVYLLRALALVAVALIVVRLSIRPLQRLMQAASALGQNLERPPLPVEGPREMRQAAETFNAMQRQLIDLMSERTQLLAAVSHDLRTPLTRIRMRIEGIVDDTLRAKLVANVAQMEELIRSLLDSVTESAQPKNRMSFDLSALLAEIVDECAESGGDTRWTGPPDVVIPGHAAGIRRVLQNLIENALRYAGNAEVELHDLNDRIEVVIKDSGPGIAEDQLATVVQPFVRGAAPCRSNTTGYGLGLSIARSIVMAHRGRLILGNQPDGGLQIVVQLPRR